MNSSVAALDIGGTKIAAAVAGADGQLVGRATAATPASAGPVAVLDVAARLVRDLTVTHGPVSAVGVGTAGIVDAANGCIVAATDAMTDWGGADVRSGLGDRLGVPVAVENDVHAHLIGELSANPELVNATVILVAVGTGVGGAVAVDGRVLRGARNLAGHVGHVPTMTSAAAGRPCPCGAIGHVEGVASGPALLATHNQQARQPATDLAEVATRAAAGDALAIEVLTDGGAEIGRLIGGLANVLDPHLVIVTGGVSGCGPTWWTALRAAAGADRLPMADAVPMEEFVTASTLGSDAPLIGAAHIARELLS